ncbi:hypothetical protein FRX31_017324 [Thalictrum thalictroides]|uniref:Uncharacterized protein n=1 Tax=Thalictrum thalictroides TaxID=46969 RepID=A0A7J6W775_THATH|nr:hypothetical protein FRX31_017324 [Thalictrum thalictroides]
MFLSQSGRPRSVEQPYGWSLWRGILASQGKFYEGISHNVMDGRFTSFWHDVWCGETSLAYNFPRIYRHASHKNGLVADHFIEGEWHPLVRRRNLIKGGRG